MLYINKNQIFLQNIRIISVIALLAVFIYTSFYNLAYSDDNLPSGSDAGKFKPESENKLPDPASRVKIQDQTKKKRISPKITKDLEFFFKKLIIVDMKALDPKEVRKIYEGYLNSKIKLSKLYEFAEKITEMYNNKGYFLSLAYIPQQKIDKEEGLVKIQVVEGAIKDIKLPEDTKKYNNQIYKDLQNIILIKPINIQVLQTELLRINDLFGYKFTGTLVNTDPDKVGEVTLVLSATKTKDNAKIVFNNFASNAVGPHKIKFYYSHPFTPFNQLSLIEENAVISSIKRFNYINLSDNIIINKYSDLNVTADATKMLPREIVKNVEIKSKANNFNIGWNFKLIRQRMQNLNLRCGFNFKNASNYILGTISSKDKIRSLKINLNYSLNVYNAGYLFDVSLTRGLKIFNSNNQPGVKVSRDGAKPNFSKLEASFSYLRRLFDDFSLQFMLNTQWANGIMFSSEEFGYGGSSMGRAFDSSEISGDHGLSGMLELSYNGWSNGSNANLTPYIYFDQGMVWHKNPTRKAKESGSSYGLGFRYYISNFNAHFGLAWPRGRAIANPIYGCTSKFPRILLEVSMFW